MTTNSQHPYFHLSKNEYGKMWLMYHPEGNGRYKFWEPINGEFWSEFEKLLNCAKSERNKAIDDCIQVLENNPGDMNLVPLLESLKL